MTDRFDPGNSRHRVMKGELELGIALNGIATFAEVNRALEDIGFHILEATDRGIEDGSSTPWYEPMVGQAGTLRNAFRRTPLGRKAMAGGLRIAEATKLFPKGSAAVIRLMDRTAEAYVAGGKTGIFTPLYCFLARKPR